MLFVKIKKIAAVKKLSALNVVFIIKISSNQQRNFKDKEMTGPAVTAASATTAVRKSAASATTAVRTAADSDAGGITTTLHNSSCHSDVQGRARGIHARSFFSFVSCSYLMKFQEFNSESCATVLPSSDSHEELVKRILQGPVFHHLLP